MMLIKATTRRKRSIREDGPKMRWAKRFNSAHRTVNQFFIRSKKNLNSIIYSTDFFRRLINVFITECECLRRGFVAVVECIKNSFVAYVSAEHNNEEKLRFYIFWMLINCSHWSRQFILCLSSRLSRYITVWFVGAALFIFSLACIESCLCKLRGVYLNLKCPLEGVWRLYIGKCA